MRIGFLSSCAVGLAIALTLGDVSSARAQQTDTTTRRTTRTSRTRRTARSSQRIPISKDRNTSTGEVAAQPAPTPTVNQDSIAAAERARQDSIAAVERARQDSIARVEQMRRDSIAAAERRRQDSIAAVEKARQDSIARADSIAAAEAAALRLRRWAGGPYIGIAGGLSMPMGDIKDAPTSNTGGYSNGWNVTIPIGWDFSNTPFGIRVDGSFDRLGAKNYNSGFNAPDVTVYSGNADLKLRLPLGRTWSRFYVLGGATASKFTGYNTNFTNPNAPTSQQSFSDASWKWGYNVGGGFNFNFGRMTGLFVESRYISVSPDNVTGFPYGEAKFVPIILGIQF
jgi:opacity protein-like surface antigen